MFIIHLRLLICCWRRVSITKKAKLKIEEESVTVIKDELREQKFEIVQEKERHEAMAMKLDDERMKLQTMAEHLSHLSHDIMIQAQLSDEKLARVERVNSCIDQTKEMIINEQTNLQHDRFVVMSSVEEINVMKMDIVRQRVEYLKEKFK